MRIIPYKSIVTNVVAMGNTEFMLDIRIILFFTQEYDSYFVSRFAGRKSDCLIFMTSDRCIPVNNTSGLNVVVVCKDELFVLCERELYVVLCLAA